MSSFKKECSIEAILLLQICQHALLSNLSSRAFLNVLNSPLKKKVEHILFEKKI